MAAIISLSQAVELLGVCVDGPGTEPVPTNARDVTIICPECADRHSGRRRTLNLNFEKDAFRCPRCNFSGYTYDFISYYTGWPKESVESKIKKGQLKSFVPSEESQRQDANRREAVDNGGTDLAPISQRHAVYSEMISIMDLSDEHRNDLIRRGLDNDSIDEIGFRSLQRYMDPSVLASKLISRGFDLRGVPGFGISKSGKWQVANFPDGGFIIPLKNGTGLIQGFQIRFDHPNDRTPKYGYFTSTNMPGGATCSGWCSWVGENMAHRDDKNAPFNVILIEGPLKAYIVNHRTGHPILAVPGVSTLRKAAGALRSMKAMGLNTVYIAYDMDAYTNEDVARALAKLCVMLDKEGINHNTLVWDLKQGKGLDDWLISQK